MSPYCPHGYSARQIAANECTPCLVADLKRAKSTIPADCEGELRDLVNRMGDEGQHTYGAALARIIDRYSGVRPMRTGHVCPDKGTGKVVLP